MKTATIYVGTYSYVASYSELLVYNSPLYMYLYSSARLKHNLQKAWDESADDTSDPPVAEAKSITALLGFTDTL